MRKKYEDIAKIQKGTRVYAIQPNQAVYEVLKNIPIPYLTRACEDIKERKIIIDAILQNHSVNQWLADAQKLGIPREDMKMLIQAFSGRMADTHYVSTEYFKYQAEIWMYDNTLVFFNWKDGIALEIQNEEIVGLIKDTYLLAKNMGKKVDQNEMLKKEY